MKIAIMHDWFITRPRGAERVALQLAQLFPEAPIYTLLWRPEYYKKLIDPGRIRTSFLQKLPNSLRQRQRYLLPLIPAAIKSLKFSEYDVVISSSSAWAKNIVTGFNTTHICYCHTPMRFAWDYEQQYLEEQQLGQVREKLARHTINWVKRWDMVGSSRVNYWLANSHTTAARIKKYYSHHARVIYPPVEVSKFKTAPKNDFYVTLSGLTPYKKVDLAIEACNLGARKLKVIGEGPERTRLEALAGPTVEFLGYVNKQRRNKLLAEARGMIFPSEEDFGIAPVEAMASGTPVIGYNHGGLTETIINGKTGLLFSKQTVEGLSEALDKFESMQFDRRALVNQASRFDEAIFNRKILEVVNKAQQQHVKTDAVS